MRPLLQHYSRLYNNTAYSRYNQTTHHQKLTLEQLWEVYNSNKEGDSANKIDKEECQSLFGSIYFVEEGMTKEEFMRKNYRIYATQQQTVSFTQNLPKEKLSSAVGSVIKEMINNGEFETKKEVILGKFTYLDEDTQLLVLEKLSHDEQESVLSKVNEETRDILRTKLDTIEELDENSSNEETKPEPPGFQ